MEIFFLRPKVEFVTRKKKCHTLLNCFLAWTEMELNLVPNWTGSNFGNFLFLCSSGNQSKDSVCHETLIPSRHLQNFKLALNQHLNLADPFCRVELPAGFNTSGWGNGSTYLWTFMHCTSVCQSRLVIQWRINSMAVLCPLPYPTTSFAAMVSVRQLN